MPLLVRLYTSPALQRLVPDWVAIALAVLRGRLWWLASAGRRSVALDRMGRLLGKSARNAEVRKTARQHLVETSVRQVIFWRSRTYDHATITGLDNLDQALALGRGVLVVSAHIGAYSVRPLLARGYPVHVMVDGRNYREPYVGYKGARWLASRKRIEEAGGRCITPPDAFSACRSALESGDVCAISFDIRGDHITPFAGGSVGVRTGPARLALVTGAPVVLGFFGRHRHHLTVRLSEPISPHTFGGIDELIAHLAAAVEREMTARPAECVWTSFLKGLTDPSPR